MGHVESSFETVLITWSQRVTETERQTGRERRTHRQRQKRGETEGERGRQTRETDSRERGTGGTPRSLPCSCSVQEGEAAVQHCEEAVHPEEFVAIADYSATDETQVAVRIRSACVDSAC